VPSQAEIQVRVRVHLMNAVSGKNLTGVFSLMESIGVWPHDIGGALRSVTDEARFCRTNATRIWGVSDPPFFRAANLDSGVAEGVAHAPDASLTAADSRADSYMGGKQRRPLNRSKVARWQGHRRGVVLVIASTEPRAERASSVPERGNTAPAVRTG
jgi:hypothetical protein